MRVLDKGFIELVDHIGSDYSILQAARTSTGNEAVKGEEKDRGLIRYLYRNEHLSPFEFATFHFHAKMPIFVARQFFRHRAFSYNEVSGRYKEFEWECFYPESWRKQSKLNKQSSIDGEDSESKDRIITYAYKTTEDAYHALLYNDAAREQARVVMPVAQYTEFFFRADLRNLLHFLELRLDEHAQYEIRVYAEAILDILQHLDSFKWTMEVFNDVNAIKTNLKKVMNVAFKEEKIGKLLSYLNDFVEEN